MPTIRKTRSKKSITTEDLFRLRLPTAIAMAPDEKRVAYTLERMDKKESKYYSNLHIVETVSGDHRQFTSGNHNDSQPVWSPKGNRIAFLSRRDKKLGIYVMPADGGAEQKLIELDAHILDLQWTPDGSSLLFTMCYHDSHFIKDEKKKKKPPVYRHVTRLHYRLDGFGFSPQATYQTYVLDLESGKLRQLTKASRDCFLPHISPNGQMVCFLSNRQRHQDLDRMNLDLFVIPFIGGKEQKIETPKGPVFVPQFAPDSKSIAYVGHDRPKAEWGFANMHVWKVGVNGSPKARDLMPMFDRQAGDLSITDTGDMGHWFSMQWSPDGKRVYFLSSDSGSTNLFYVPAAGGKPTRVFKGKCHIKAMSLGGRGKNVALVHADLKNPGEVVIAPTSYGGETKARSLTDLNPFLSKSVRLGRTREVWFKSFDGTAIQGWLVTPPGFNPKRSYPGLLEIHGGPRVQYAHTFFHEMQLLAAKGYVVLYTNPRGGGGRGETWASAITADWGSLDYRDCMAAADYLESRSYVNGSRMGVTGGSYGGFMTNWMIGHTNRFRAAVTQRSVVNLTSFMGSSDFGYAFENEFDGWPWTNPETYQKCSPMSYFKNVRTPVLIIHSENDMRCGIEQAEQMFVMLKVLGRKVELVRFPEESHGLSRHGRPDRRVARLEWILKWFDKYLK